jgi:hypothetical protein
MFFRSHLHTALLTTIFLSCVFFLCAPALTHAQLVTCGNDITTTGAAGGGTIISGECTVCDLAIVASNVLNAFVLLVVIAAALSFVHAGVLYISSPGKPGNISRAHHVFTSTLVALIVVLSAYLLIDVFMRMLLPGGQVQGHMWSDVLCENGGNSSYTVPPLAPLPTPATVPLIPVPENAPYDCNDMQSLQDEFGGAGPVNAPGLDAMIACYRAAVGPLQGAQPIYTYDISSPTCNYTNGTSVCERCNHSPNSCHYGRGVGQGAMAADFNGPDEVALFNALIQARPTCGGRVIFEGNHSHISMDTCPNY